MVRNRKAAESETDEERFSKLFRQHYAPILAFARRRVGADACQEIAAETFLVAWRRFDSVPESALPWLYQVAAFTIANYRRRESKTVPLGAGSNLDRLTSVSNSEDETVSAVLIGRAFATLGPKDQEVLRLAAWDGLSSLDGAAVLGCSVTAYKVRLHRARGRLAKRFATPLGLSPTDPANEASGTGRPTTNPKFRAAEETA
jgi:RNA polymerase sigma-70 factor (ECF subfamily)